MSDVSGKNGFQQTLQIFLVVVHPRSQIGDRLMRPALTGAIEFQRLFLPFQIIFLVMTGRRA
jgi:hypothetical protein